jgi:hypothetical protein
MIDFELDFAGKVFVAGCTFYPLSSAGTHAAGVSRENISVLATAVGVPLLDGGRQGPTLFCSLIRVCRAFYLEGNLEEDADIVIPDHGPELLLATCASRVVVRPACSSWNYLDGGEFSPRVPVHSALTTPSLVSSLD